VREDGVSKKREMRDGTDLYETAIRMSRPASHDKASSTSHLLQDWVALPSASNRRFRSKSVDGARELALLLRLLPAGASCRARPETQPC